MSEDREEDRAKRDKKVTAAITDAPQEEFISDVNRPSKPENDPDAPEPDNPRERKSTAQ
ncbi:hypothetical protein BH18VER1_BH18VER1_18270 [soil metagenome]